MLQRIIDNLEEVNYSILEAYQVLLCTSVKPRLAIINTNRDDEPTQRYIRNKKKKCEHFGIAVDVFEPTSMDELTTLISKLNKDTAFTSIIMQYPFANWVTATVQETFDLVDPRKDVDRLHSCWYYNEKSSNLPLTSLGILKIIEELQRKKKIKEGCKILFNGNGVTTNKRLFLKMFNDGVFDCRIVNSKTPKKSVQELIDWADIIVSGVGKKDSLLCKGKIVICPTILKVSEKTFVSDLCFGLRKDNITHKVIGGIGKLTTSNLLCRIYYDAELFRKFENKN